MNDLNHYIQRAAALDVILQDAIGWLVRVDERLRDKPALAAFKQSLALGRQDIEERRRGILSEEAHT